MGWLTSNQRGSSLIEIMIALVIALVVTAAASAAYIHQQRFYRNQAMLAETDESTQVAMNVLSKNIRLARAGTDPTNAILEACACSIRFRCNRNNVSTFFTGTSTGPTISAESVAGFSVNDTVSVTNWSTWVSRSITAVQATPPRLTLNTALPSSFPTGSGVFQNRTISYALDIANKWLQMDGQVLAVNLETDANGFFQGGEPLFRYYTETDTELVPPGTGSCLTRCLLPADRTTLRKARIFITAETPLAINPVTGEKGIVTHETTVRLRHPTP